jgi:molecular chaperone HtpG
MASDNPDPPSAVPDTGDPVELPFQAEVQKVLSLVINSLYTHKEVFLRELVSNASDALDRARFLALTRNDIATQVGEPRITIRADDVARTLTVEDNGIGMTKDEVVKNLGTIARSGSVEFVKAHAQSAASAEAGLKMIGQFGVGFYAAFMVASRVDVHTRSMLPGADPVVWRSTGAGSFTILRGEREHTGTEIVIHLKDDAREYAKAWRIMEIIRKYSDFVQFPIYVNDELAGRSSAIWALPKAQVKDEQHTEFFRKITGSDAQTPLLHVHMTIDAPVQFHALLYVPEKAPLDLFSRDRRGVRLYARRVLVMESCDELTPVYLRFLRGVVDSEDVPLNVSREMLQEDRTIQKIEQQLTKSVLRAMNDLAESDPEKYAKLWSEFGPVFKEGVATDAIRRDELAGLCRFESLKAGPGKLVSLRQYVDAMPPAQREIFYITGPSRAGIEKSPHLEAFRARGMDVLLLSHPVDEWLVQALTDFDKRKLKSIAHGDIDLGDEPEPEGNCDIDAAVRAVKSALGDRVKDVRAGKRLTDSASCLVAAEGDPGANMERIMKMFDGTTAESPRILELNPSHPILRNLGQIATREPGSARIAQWSELLFDQAMLAEGIVKEPDRVVRRIQDLLVELSNAVVSKT